MRNQKNSGAGKWLQRLSMCAMLAASLESGAQSLFEEDSNRWIEKALPSKASKEAPSVKQGAVVKKPSAVVRKATATDSDASLKANKDGVQRKNILSLVPDDAKDSPSALTGNSKNTKAHSGDVHVLEVLKEPTIKSETKQEVIPVLPPKLGRPIVMHYYIDPDLSVYGVSSIEVAFESAGRLWAPCGVEWKSLGMRSHQKKDGDHLLDSVFFPAYLKGIHLTGAAIVSKGASGQTSSWAVALDTQDLNGHDAMVALVAHEMGHVLGVGHTTNRRSLMQEEQRDRSLRLTPEDIATCIKSVENWHQEESFALTQKGTGNWASRAVLRAAYAGFEIK